MLPDYKPGDYFECGEGTEYSKILILSEDRCIIKVGLGEGSDMSIKEWLSLIKGREATIQNTSRKDKCRGCPIEKSGCFDDDCSYRHSGIGQIKVMRSISSGSGYDSSSSSDSLNWKNTAIIRTPISTELYYDKEGPVEDAVKPKVRRGTMPPKYLVDIEDLEYEPVGLQQQPTIRYEFSKSFDEPLAIQSQPSAIQSQKSVMNLQTIPKPRISWYYRVFLCGFFDD